MVEKKADGVGIKRPGILLLSVFYVLLLVRSPRRANKGPLHPIQLNISTQWAARKFNAI